MTLELLPGFHAHADRFLWHALTSTAILADLHIGFELQLAEAAGIEPDPSPLTEPWQSIVALNPARVIFAGDIFQERDPEPQSITYFHSLLDMLPDSADIIITPGNHDPCQRDMRELIGSRVTVAKSARFSNILVAHGHDLEHVELTQNLLIVGHLHPAVTLADRLQSAKMICFAWTPSLIILPTFSPLPLGTTLLSARKWILDLPMPSTSQIHIAGIVRDQVLNFGPLSDLV